MKISIFPPEKNLFILHGEVFAMARTCTCKTKNYDNQRIQNFILHIACQTFDLSVQYLNLNVLKYVTLLMSFDEICDPPDGF